MTYWKTARTHENDFINTANVLIVFMNQNATSGMPTAKKFSRKFTELGRLPQIHPIPKDTYETLH
jgi:hypothetical protein